MTAEPPSVATKTPEPASVGDVTVAVYVPLPTFVTAPIVPVPDCFVIVTVAPPVVRFVPLASRACTVRTCVAVPFAVIDAEVGVSVDMAALAAPGRAIVLVEVFVLGVVVALSVAVAITS